MMKKNVIAAFFLVCITIIALLSYKLFSTFLWASISDDGTKFIYLQEEEGIVVYSKSHTNKYQKEIVGESSRIAITPINPDKESFRVLSHGYAVDKNYLYFGSTALASSGEVDLSSVEAINSCYIKDNKGVYTDPWMWLTNVNPATFAAISDYTHGQICIGYDDKHIYMWPEIVKNPQGKPINFWFDNIKIFNEKDFGDYQPIHEQGKLYLREGEHYQENLINNPTYIWCQLWFDKDALKFFLPDSDGKLFSPPPSQLDDLLKNTYGCHRSFDMIDSPYEGYFAVNLINEYMQNNFYEGYSCDSLDRHKYFHDIDVISHSHSPKNTYQAYGYVVWYTQTPEGNLEECGGGEMILEIKINKNKVEIINNYEFERPQGNQRKRLPYTNEERSKFLDAIHQQAIDYFWSQW